MSAPVAAPCMHCKKRPAVRRVHVATVGSVPVDLGLCDCDYLRCREPKCRAVVGNLPAATTHCPECGTRL